MRQTLIYTQAAITCFKLTTETLEEGVKKNMFEVNDKDSRTMPTSFSGACIVNFQQTNAG